MDLKIYSARVPMDMHNVFSACKPGEEYAERLVKSVVHPHMRLFIAAIHKKRPGWVFLGEDYGVYNNTSLAYTRLSFVVVQDGEELGKVSLTLNRSGESVYCVGNPRIDAQRTRASAVKTKHLTKAVNETLKHFYAKTLSERIQEATGDADRVLTSANHGARYDFERLVRRVQEPLLYHLATDSKALDSLRLPDEETKQLITKAAESCVLHKQVADIYAAKEGGKALLVTLISGGIYVSPANRPSEAVGYSYETLPAYVGTALGMLKLVDPSVSIAGIGMRMSDTTFIVVKPAGEP